MKHFFYLCFLLFSFTMVEAQEAQLKQTIKGAVVDEQSGHALAQVSVTVDGLPASGSITDSTGSFRLPDVPIGRHTVRASLMGFEEAIIRNVEVTSTKEVILELRLREKVVKLSEVVVRAGKPKNKALNEAAVVSARQFSVDEAVRYSGTRNDPSRMAQNFAGVSGANDARNDIIIRGNSPAGVLWRMDGIDIPNPNHYNTLGSTGGPVTILNTNTLRNSDFITSAFPAQYGNALAGVFDLRMRNGNDERYEFLGQMGFNGFEFGAEGPLKIGGKASFLFNYRYSLVAAIQQFGLSVGTGSATPYYQDLNFKINIPTAKAGNFSLFGLAGESHITFDALDEDNLYNTNDGSLRDRNFRSMTGITGFSHQYFFNPTTSGKFTLAAAGLLSKYQESFYGVKPDSIAYYKKNVQLKYSAGYTLNKKFSSRDQMTAGVVADLSRLKLRNDYIPDGSQELMTLFDTRNWSWLLRSYVNLGHRFSDKLSTNLGVHGQWFTLNNSVSIEPRFNLKYQLRPDQSLSFGAGLHSQLQPLEVYFYESKNNAGQVSLTNHDLGMSKSLHTVLGYDISFSRQMRLKAEVYGQYIYHAAVEQTPSSFSMMNAGADFYFPDRTNLVNRGDGYNYGVELTLERFLDQGFYFLVTGSLFESKYRGSDRVWRNTAFNSNYTFNFLVGKEIQLSTRSSFGIDCKFAYAGGQRYTAFDLAASSAAGYVIFREDQAYALQNTAYQRLDFKLSYSRNGKKTTQKWYVDLQNLTDRKNLYFRTLNPQNGKTGEIYQIGFFPNINYMITF